MARGDFGGTRLNFSKVKDARAEEIFGLDDLKAGEMVKKVWDFVKKNELSHK